MTTQAQQVKPRRFSGKLALLGLLVVWLVMVVALYVVLVKLKVGGAQALRSQPHGAVQGAHTKP